MSSREQILGRVRAALGDVPRQEPSYEQAVDRSYQREHGRRDHARTVDLLAVHLDDYRARVHRCGPGELAELIAGLLRERGARSVVVPAGLPEGWLGAVGEGVRVLPDETTRTATELDAVDSVVTGCAVAVAETGTLVLNAGPDQGRRRITLVPDHHICVVRTAEQVVSSVPQAVARLDPLRPQTWISGPSATSDIELDRVEGVHGPRALDVILLDGEGT